MTGSTLLAGSTFGHYELRKLLGKGGMGEVYEARDTAKDRIVAIKILSEGLSDDDIYRERFRRESQAAAKLQEPHVVPIHDWGDVDGTLYIDMRLVRGVDLRKLLRNGPLEPERAVAIVRQIASALDAAHADGLVHRDVKPENIIVTGDDFAYLVDFGIAGSPDETRLTQVGNAIGSFAYMAPERLTGQSVSPAADTYSLACVLYESLTGAAPFAAHDMALLVTAHTLAPPPRPSAVNPAVPQTFNEVIARGMTKEPADRYKSAGALGRAAQRALHCEADTYVNATKPAAAWPTAAGASPGHPLPGGYAPGSSSAPGYEQSRSSERQPHRPTHWRTASRR
jgi:serine/threonine kinase PknH